MTKTNNQTALAAMRTKATKANRKANPAEAPKAHLLSDADKAKGRAKAERMAGKAKASNQTAIPAAATDATNPDNTVVPSRKPRGKVLTEKDIAGNKPTAKELKAQLAKELAQEAAATGAVRASDMIAVSGPHPQSAGYHMVGTGPNNAVTVPDHQFVGKVAEAAKLGLSFRAFKEVFAEAKRTATGKLAQGLDGRSAPHSAKAAADHNSAARGTNKADKAQSRKATETAKKAERKAAAQAKAAPKADDNRKIAVLDKKFTYGKDGTARRASWDACKASKTVAEYAAKGGALKYLPRWVSAGAIKLG